MGLTSWLLKLTPPSAIRRLCWPSGFHPCLQHRAPVSRTSAACRLRDIRLLTFFRSGLPAPSAVLCLLLTSRSASQRRPFRRKARSPQVRNHAFRPQPPNLRRRPLVAGALQSFACSPRSVTPHIRFLYVGSDFRSALLSAYASRHTTLRFT